MTLNKERDIAKEIFKNTTEEMSSELTGWRGEKYQDFPRERELSGLLLRVTKKKC